MHEGKHGILDGLDDMDALFGNGEDDADGDTKKPDAHHDHNHDHGHDHKHDQAHGDQADKVPDGK